MSQYGCDPRRRPTRPRRRRALPRWLRCPPAGPVRRSTVGVGKDPANADASTDVPTVTSWSASAAPVASSVSSQRHRSRPSTSTACNASPPGPSNPSAGTGHPRPTMGKPGTYISRHHMHGVGVLPGVSCCKGPGVHVRYISFRNRTIATHILVVDLLRGMLAMWMRART
jgi:hypothetical protein